MEERDRDYTEILTEVGRIAVDAINDNEGVPTHLVAMAIGCRLIERFPDLTLRPQSTVTEEMIEALKAIRGRIPETCTTCVEDEIAEICDAALSKVSPLVR